MGKPYRPASLSDKEVIEMMKNVYDFETDRLEKTEDKYIFYDKAGNVCEVPKEEFLPKE